MSKLYRADTTECEVAVYLTRAPRKTRPADTLLVFALPFKTG